MRFLHEQAEFPELLMAVERETQVEVALVEKDYWITHCLWALHETGLEIMRVARTTSGTTPGCSS